MNKRAGITAAAVVVIIVGGGVLAYMHMNKSASSAASTASTVAAVNNSILKTKASSSLGQYMTDPSGKALYTFAGDKAGVSNCSGTCLATWPAYVDTGATTGLPAGVGTITRSDNGKVQFTYNGMPLYYFVGDILGHVNGNGVSDFHVAKPASATTATPTPATAASASSSSSW